MKIALILALVASVTWAQPYPGYVKGVGGPPITRDQWNPFSLAVARLDAQRADVKAYGAVGDGSDDTVAIQAALDSGAATVLFPGSFTACGLILRRNVQVLQGVGPGSELVRSSGCGTHLLATSSAAPFAQDVTIRDIKLRASGSTGNFSLVSINGAFLRTLTIDHIECDISAGGFCVNVAGIDALTITNSQFYGDCNQTIQDKAIQTSRNVRWLDVSDNTFECLYFGLTLDAVGPNADSQFRYSRNRADGLWWLQQTLYTNSGGTVTYSPTVLTDSAASFATIPTQTTVRVLPVRASGTTTGLAGTKLQDSATDFAAAGVKRNDLVRTATAFASVMTDAIDNSTCTGSGAPYEDCTGAGTGSNEHTLWVDGWRDRTTYRPIAAPATGTAYTVYRVLLGDRTSNTGTTVTCTTTFNGFHDMDGNAVTPANGSLYEVSTPHPDYLLNVESRAVRGVIAQNLHRRPWSDCFGSSLNNTTIVGNVCSDGQDGCFTVGGTGVQVLGNLAFHCGATGFFVRGSGHVFTGNTGIDNRWTNGNAGLAPGLGACFDINISTDNVFNANTCLRNNTNMPLATYGVALRGASTNNQFGLNTISGFVTGTVHLAATATTATFDRRSASGTVTDAGASPKVNDLLRTDSPATCNAAATSLRYWDASLNEECTCNGSNWCQVDGGGCTSNASCG